MRIPVVLFILLIIAVPFLAQAAWWWPFGDDGVEYTITIKGADSKTGIWFSKLKLDEPNTAKPPHDMDQLRQEAVSVAAKIRKALYAKGYYDAIITQDISGAREPYSVEYTIAAGPRYKISAIYADWPGQSLKKLGDIPIITRANQPVDVAIIQEDATLLASEIGKNACLLSLSVTPLLKLRGDTHNAELSFRIAHGPSANFGRTIITGNPTVRDKVIQRAISWKQGECFEQEKINSTRNSLIQNQLLASVNVTPGTQPDAQGQVPVAISVKERVPRTITSGLNYSTDQGAGLVLGWEHRNLFGNAEKFNSVLTLAQQEQSLVNNLRIPAFLRNDQTLALLGGVRRENTDAYTSNSLDTGATIERRLSSRVNSGLGVAYRLTQTEDVLEGDSKYGLLSFPGFLEYNTRDNELDTRKGLFGRLAVTPYTETFGDGGQFFKTQATGQTYFSSDAIKFKPTLALRLTAGSIAGADGVDVPSDIRFYAGGGGSVRGYSFQSLSPRTNGEPVGGSSLLVGSTEIRLRFTETIGGALFADAGNAYEDTLPGFADKLYYGAGFGARYYSPIGPLRVDVGFPLNGRDIGETGFKLYVSLGQSF